jgi:hypothetical protein
VKIVHYVFFVYLELRRKSIRGRSEMMSAVKQLGLYLLALYWMVLPTCANVVLVVAIDRHIFVPTLILTIINKLMGLWILLVFLQFRQVSSRRTTEETDGSGGEDSLRMGGAAARNAKEKKCWLRDSQETFSIFDGTNASKAWSEFVHDGDLDS